MTTIKEAFSIDEDNKTVLVSEYLFRTDLDIYSEIVDLQINKYSIIFY